MAEVGQVKRLSLRSDPSEFSAARGWISDLLRGSGWIEQEIRELTLAANEALANAHRWGYRGRTCEPIDLAVRLQENVVRIEVRDHGSGFDIGKVERPVPRRPAESGYGIFLMRELTDHVLHESSSVGTRVVLTRRKGGCSKFGGEDIS